MLEQVSSGARIIGSDPAGPGEHVFGVEGCRRRKLTADDPACITPHTLQSILSAEWRHLTKRQYPGQWPYRTAQECPCRGQSS